jgi:hypothetical protein
VTAPIVRIRVVGLMPNLWWIGPSPWHSLPTAPDVAFRCCDEGSTAVIASVMLHLPVEDSDVAVTVVVRSPAPDWGDHLTSVHGFSR